MRIAQVVSSYTPRIGGVETHVRRLAEGLTEHGDEIVVLTHQAGDAPSDERLGGVRVLRFPLSVRSQNYELSVPLFRYLKMHAAEFDIAHAHSYHTLVGHAAVNARLPFVFTTHCAGTGHTYFRAFLYRLYRPAGNRLMRGAHAVICVSEAERERLVGDFPRAADKTIVMPNGTDRELLARRNEPALPGGGQVPQGAPIVLTVGRLERYKNVDLIIDAFRALPSGTALVIVGDGPDRARLERHAEAARLSTAVIFAGKVSDADLARLLTRAHVVTSASDHEAFGLTLADGLAAGARVVASAIPAHAELARRAGPDAPIALTDPRDRKTFTHLLAAGLRAGRVPVPDVKLPTWADVAADTRELYSLILSETGSQPPSLRGPGRSQATRKRAGNDRPQAVSRSPWRNP